MEFTLYTDKEIKIKLKPFISPRIKGEGVEIFKKMENLDPAIKMQKRMIDIALSLKDEVPDSDGLTEAEIYQNLLKSGKIPKETMKELTEIGMQVTKLQPEIEKELDLLKIELFKILADEKSIPTEIKELWDDKEFWLDQDLGGIEEEINSFRDKIKLRVKVNF